MCNTLILYLPFCLHFHCSLNCVCSVAWESHLLLFNGIRIHVCVCIYELTCCNCTTLTVRCMCCIFDYSLALPRHLAACGGIQFSNRMCVRIFSLSSLVYDHTGWFVLFALLFNGCYEKLLDFVGILDSIMSWCIYSFDCIIFCWIGVFIVCDTCVWLGTITAHT